MKYVGFPDGLVETIENLKGWYKWICEERPFTNHYSILDGDTYCGEIFYSIDKSHDDSASLDIKLYKSDL